VVCGGHADRTLVAGEEAARYRVLQHLLECGADAGIAARGSLGRPVEAARGLHQPKQYRIVWAEAAALLDDVGSRQG
jgi:hypothetical protein